MIRPELIGAFQEVAEVLAPVLSTDVCIEGAGDTALEAIGDVLKRVVLHIAKRKEK